MKATREVISARYYPRVVVQSLPRDITPSSTFALHMSEYPITVSCPQDSEIEKKVIKKKEYYSHVVVQDLPRGILQNLSGGGVPPSDTLTLCFPERLATISCLKGDVKVMKKEGYDSRVLIQESPRVISESVSGSGSMPRVLKFSMAATCPRYGVVEDGFNLFLAAKDPSKYDSALPDTSVPSVVESTITIFHFDERAEDGRECPHVVVQSSM